VANFCQFNGCARAEGFDPAKVEGVLNRWIVGETQKTAAAVTEALAACSFDAAANGLYRFIWNTYCDWYAELAKPALKGEDGPEKAETQATAAWALDVILKLLHPIMPFLTEELWRQTADLGAAREDGLLIMAPWPELPASLVDAKAEAEIGLVVDTISEGRSVRSALNVPGSAKPPLLVVDATAAQRAVFEANAPIIAQLLRVSEVSFSGETAAGAIPFVVAGAGLALPVAEFIDLDAEKARLSKEIAALTADIEKTSKKLDNPDFIARAPEEVVEENRERLAEAEAAKAKLEAALKLLQAVV
jgi:valyl-tRNA synthetase